MAEVISDDAFFDPETVNLFIKGVYLPTLSNLVCIS